MTSDPLRSHLERLSTRHALAKSHFRYLRWLKRKVGFEPRVVYDIGASVIHWTRGARELWPDAEFILFDAFEPARFLYEGHRHWIGVLSNRDDREVQFYQNDYRPGGNSYYREVGYKNGIHFPIGTHQIRVARTLDAVVREHGFPPPDLVKIDVQGAERDVIEGGSTTLASARRLIVEMQHEAYNDGAPMVHETLPWIEARGWYCDALLFSNNGPDGDYGFARSDFTVRGKRPRYEADPR